MIRFGKYKSEITTIKTPELLSRSAVRRGFSLRVFGLILSVLAAVTVLTVTVIIIASRRAADRNEISYQELMGSEEPKPIDLAEAGKSATDIRSFAGQMGEMVWTSQNDRGEIVQEFGWKHLEPMESGKFKVEKPQARFYLKNGNTLQIQSAKGEVYRPASSDLPETGRFDDGVIIRMYAGHLHDDLKDKTPIGEMITDSITFNTNIGRISTEEKFFVTSNRFEFSGKGLDVLYNQVAERVEKLDIYKGQYLTYVINQSQTGKDQDKVLSINSTKNKPDTDTADYKIIPVINKDQEAPTDATDADSEIDITNDNHEKKSVKHDYYHIVFSDKVVLRRDRRLIMSDILDAKVHLVDGKLELPGGEVYSGKEPINQNQAAADVFSPRHLIGLPGELAALILMQTPQNNSEEGGQPAASTDSRRSLLTSGDPRDLLHINWKGALRVRPLDNKPEILSQDSAYVSFTGDRVRLLDEDSKDNATCHLLEYYANRKVVLLHGQVGGDLVMRSGKGDVIRGNDFSLNLTTGLGRFLGKGEAIQAAADNDYPDKNATRASIKWNDRMLLTFNVRGESLQDLREAVCEGDVQIDHPEFRLDGDWLRVNFNNSNVVNESSVKQVEVKGDVQANIYSRGKVACDQITAVMANPSIGNTYPRVVTATGAVKASDNTGKMIIADMAEIEFGKSSDLTDAEEPVILRFEARSDNNDLLIHGEDGVLAAGTHILAENQGEAIQLSGTPATAQTNDGKITANELSLDNKQNIVTADGKGTFNYAHKNQAEFTENLNVSWQDRMIYDGKRGVAHFLGSVSGLYQPEINTENRINCEDLTVTFDPRSEDNNSSSDTLAMGNILSLDAQESASVEHKRFANIDKSVLDQLLNIAGSRIIFDNVSRTLDVPGPGRLVIADEQTYNQKNSGDNSAEEISFRTGRTLFSWQGDMHFSADQGSIVMKQDVEMRHRDKPDAELMVMFCQNLSAYTNPVELPGKSDSTIPDEPGVELLRAIAKNDVYIEYGKRILTADQVSYDAGKGLIAAHSNPGNTVMTMQDGDLTPQFMDWLEWNLVSNELQMHNIRPVNIPATRR